MEVKSKRKPSERQKRVAKLKIENLTREQPLTDIEILKRSNYSTTTAETKSTYVMNSEGVQEELKAQGFSEENAKKVVEEIMLNTNVEPNARLKATDQVFKVIGSYAPEKHINANIQVDDISRNKTKSAISRFLQRD